MVELAEEKKLTEMIEEYLDGGEQDS